MSTDVRKSGAHDEALANEYKQWQKVHSKMKECPPSDGRDYLKHANNLLVLLEGVSELHPIAKAVVLSFKTAVMFEQDRRENDARVTAVFLAQTDMMRILLDVDDLATRRQNRWPDAENLRSTAKLGLILSDMEKEIKSCGNSMDTYYKEARFVKFWKAQDWKKRMLGHIAEFNDQRVRLQQTLQVQVAVGVEDLVLKMDVVLSHFFTPKSDWEKNLDKKTRNLGPPSAWINDPAVLQSLISETKDPAFSFAHAAGKSTADKIKDTDKPVESEKDKAKIAFATDAQLTKVKKELELSLDILCERNRDMFEVKLSFHTKQLEQSIANSAQLVIKSLQGPYDRLVHEDLRHLWKEMNWIFCVEGKFFVSAVFEFYLDRFSGKKHVDKAEPGAEEEHGVDSNLDGQTVSNSGSAPRFSFLSRLGAVNHPDSWTLEYIALYGDNITQAIDNDNSGFIRISEANAFSQAIPKGWNLPQWCAYCAAGWAYEARIYRTRISKMLTTLTEMQAKVLGTNRGFLVEFSTFNFDTICHAFSREPTGQRTPNATQELRDLVRQKVIEQDNLYRGYLQSLKWTLEDEATIHLLYGGKAPEKYMLQFCTLVLEQTLALARKCSTVTVDIREWIRLSSAFQLMRKITVNRVAELKVRFDDSKFSGEGIDTYYGGMWTYFDVYVPCSFEELVDALSEQSIYDDFPVTQITAASAYLQYPSWEAHVKTLKRSDIPRLIPKAWDPVYETLYENMPDRTFYSQFPDEWYCDRCGKAPTGEKNYRCLSPSCRYPAFDFCESCHNLPPAQHSVKNHTHRHPALLVALRYSTVQDEKFALEAEIVFEQLAQELSAQDRYDYATSAEHLKDGATLNEAYDEDDLLDNAANEFAGGYNENDDGDDADSDGALERRKYTTPARTVLKCGSCDEAIQVESEFFKCIGHSCISLYFCKHCAMHYPRKEAPEGIHEWWHSLLCLRKDLILGHWDNTPITQGGESDETRAIQSPDDIIHARIGKLEDKLDTIYASNASLEERVKGLEAKIDIVVTGLQKLLGGQLAPAPAPPGVPAARQLQGAPSGQSHEVSSREIHGPTSRQVQAPTSRAIPNYTHAQDVTPSEGPGLLQQVRDHSYHARGQEQQHQEQQTYQEQRGYEPEGQEDPEQNQGHDYHARGQERGMYYEQRGYEPEEPAQPEYEPEEPEEPEYEPEEPEEPEWLGNAADEFAQDAEEPEDDYY
ncbi:hypothetical protein CVT25_003792 [Psilocybe cyanescens]|uniref:ZZ-type domain-containing protein n=1 Tax=Psilocybe cyanescens TaxID=93625 RepID=A0A409WX48_PSICY|nr:hypothetical protein CVT25_003792 [Psilocybe cyanescens]